MDQRIINLYDSFTHGDINRRDFLDRLAALTGSTAAAAALLPLLANDYAQATVVTENDARLAIALRTNLHLAHLNGAVRQLKRQ